MNASNLHPTAHGLADSLNRIARHSTRFRVQSTAVVFNIQLANATSSPVSGVILYVNGVAAANQITPSLTIPANGSATIDGAGHLAVHDAAGTFRFRVGSTTLTGTYISGASTVTLTFHTAFIEIVKDVGT